MAQIVKIKDEYFVEYWAQGLKFRKKGGPEKAMAEKLLQQIKESVPANIEDIYQVRSDRLDRLQKSYSEHLKQTITPLTRKRLLASVDNFSAYVALQDDAILMQALTPRLLNDYFVDFAKDENVKKTTAHFYLLKAFFEYAIGVGAINDNPLLHVNVIKANPFYCPRTFTEANVSRMLAQAPSQDVQMMLIIALTTGLSASDIMRLEVTDFDSEQKLLTYAGCQWPLDVRIASWLREKDFNQRPFSKENAVQFAKMYNNQIIRNTFARHVLAKGVSLMQLCRYLREQDIYRVLPYTHFIKTEPLM